MKYDIGVVGLGVMGHNLAMNMERNGFSVAGYDLDSAKSAAFLEGRATGKNITTVESPSELMEVLEKPRRVLLMVPAGEPVDKAITNLIPYLETGDILMDGGNSFFQDTERRNQALETEGYYFIGMGVSGGEHGALWGPSIMPGGQPEAWEAVAPILIAIAAKAEDGEPCVTHIGTKGAGHYVKMVHNGIEYADMQLIAEIYDILHRGLGLTNAELAAVFGEWNSGELKSYLIEITAHILTFVDPDLGIPLVDVILDDAAQKGTGKWTSQNALDLGVPTPSINAAVESRLLSSLKEERMLASQVISGPKNKYRGNRQELIEAARQALYASKITSYAQGMSLLSSASQEYNYGLRLNEIAKIWRAGCIIRAALLGDIMEAYQSDPDLTNLLVEDLSRGKVENRQEAWRYIVKTAVELGIPTLGLSTSLAYFDAYRSERLPANLTQAQRDYFGAHTYRRIDRAGSFHTEW